MKTTWFGTCKDCGFVTFTQPDSDSRICYCTKCNSTIDVDDLRREMMGNPLSAEEDETSSKGKEYEFKSEKENGFIYAERCIKTEGVNTKLGYFRYDKVEFLVDGKVVKTLENVISLKEKEL